MVCLETNATLRSLSPIIDSNSRAIILGTFPSEVSLEQKEYYANKRNHFWKIIYSISDSEFQCSYEKRVAFVLQKEIAIWDVLKSCTRKGSSDKHIADGVPNEFNRLFDEHPKLMFVFFNGKKAHSLFQDIISVNKKHKARLIFKTLSSKSPANTIPFESKVDSWREVRRSLEAVTDVFSVLD